MKRTRNGGALALAAAGWFLQSGVAQACEGCKQAVQNGMKGEEVSAASIGYGWSVGFMLIVTFSVIGSLGLMIYRSCQTLSRAQAQALADEDRR